MKPNVPIDASVTPNSTTSPFYNMFPLAVVGDIVGINDDPNVKGLYLSKNLVTISSSIPASPAPMSTQISAGEMVSDAPIVGFRHDIFKILYPDPLPSPPPLFQQAPAPHDASIEGSVSPFFGPTTMEIGSITAAGVSGQPAPPGGPLKPDGTPVITGGDWAITGGTGAFLGVTGQIGGQGGGKIRMASVTEDPSQRKHNAAPKGTYTQTIGLYVIPLMRPQIIEVFQYIEGVIVYISQDNPARVGHSLILYATGLGPVRSPRKVDVPIGQPFTENTTVISPVTVTIGNTTIPIAPLSAQGVPGCSNGYSVEFTLPPDLSPVTYPEPMQIQITSLWIPSAVAYVYVR